MANKLIIICGLPASGKTMIAKQLSKNLKMSCLHKDTIKEGLYDLFKMKTLGDSKHIGKISIMLLFKIADEQLRRGIDLIIEAPFTFSEDYFMFEKWKNKYNIRIYSVICSVDFETRKKRYRSRKRHKAHHDEERILHNEKIRYILVSRI